jgi:hypothetical protein
MGSGLEVLLDDVFTFVCALDAVLGWELEVSVGSFDIIYHLF